MTKELANEHKSLTPLNNLRRLRGSWRRSSKEPVSSELILELLREEAADRLDLFDVAQLAVVLQTCRDHVSASAAGRVLFANSRLEKSSNNVDRLKEYLARFGLRFEDISTRKW